MSSSLPPFAHAWLQQHLAGAAKMEALRLEELRRMTEDDAAKIFALLDPPHPYPLRQSSGLVQQQYWFKLQREQQDPIAEAAGERSSGSSR
jgi:hypothetical protein